MTPAIEFENVDKSFLDWSDRPDNIKKTLVQILRADFSFGKRAQISVLENINFKIDNGEFVGIIGRNGAGKSTILKMISGIYQPNKGSVRINGKVAPLLALGAGFSEELSGIENIYLNSSILGFSHSEVEINLQKIIDFSELDEKISVPLKTYSSGMLVRLAFSIAAFMKAPILLFDEILAVGDVGFQRKCLKKIEEMHMNGRTIILVTHSPEQIRNHCTRAIVIDQKKIVFDGSPAEATRIYESWFSNV